VEESVHTFLYTVISTHRIVLLLSSTVPIHFLSKDLKDKEIRYGIPFN
jgi:hypothetical protein